MKKELHLFIIWKNALEKEEEILKDIKESFTIRNIFKVIWNDKNWSTNLSRFYGTSLPDESAKEKHCGKEYFIAIIIEDNNPNYDLRTTSHGDEIVNTRVFDKKELYRKMTGGGHKVHATNNTNEFNHDITLLFGKNTNDFKKSYKPNLKQQEYTQDLIGTNGWKNIKELFYVLNNTCEYCILRDYQDNFKDAEVIKNYDIDILAKSFDEIKWITNAKTDFIDNHIQQIIQLSNNNILFDIKTIDDGYYCYNLSNEILKTRIKKNFYYIPERTIEYYSCLLHSLIHKNNFETEYNERLSNIFSEFHDKTKEKDFYIKKCANWMEENNYDITIETQNPSKMNVENIKLFPNELYKNNFFEELELIKKIHELEIINGQLKIEINNINELKLINEQLKNEINKKDYELKELYDYNNKIINSKGWKILEKFRKFKRIISHKKSV